MSFVNIETCRRIRKRSLVSTLALGAAGVELAVNSNNITANALGTISLGVGIISLVVALNAHDQIQIAAQTIRNEVADANSRGL